MKTETKRSYVIILQVRALLLRIYKKVIKKEKF